MKYLFLAFVLTLSYNAILAQKDDSLKIVELPSNVKTQLINYLKKNESLSSSEIGAMYVFNLQNPNDLLFRDGIYTFRLMGAHFHRRIFIVDGSEIKIFNSIVIDSLLQEFNSFIKKSTLPIRKKIEYLKAISAFLDEEYEAENK